MQTIFENLSIGAFAKAAGVNVETIRFYQRKGLLPEPARAHGSIRRYGATDLARLGFIKSAQGVGFSLDEIAELLKLDDGAHCAEARRIAEHKLAVLRQKLADLMAMERTLSALVGACEKRRGKVCCPLIASLQAPR